MLKTPFLLGSLLPHHGPSSAQQIPVLISLQKHLVILGGWNIWREAKILLPIPSLQLSIKGCLVGMEARVLRVFFFRHLYRWSVGSWVSPDGVSQECSFGVPPPPLLALRQ